MGYITVYVPADPGEPPTPARAATNSELLVGFNLGWNAGATSNEALVGNGVFSFSALPTSLGVVVGLSTTSASFYPQIQYAFYLNRAKLVIYENGVPVTGYTAYSSGSTFGIQRRGCIIEYLLNGVIIYTSLIQVQAPLVANAFLYSSGDSVVDAEFGSTVVGSATGAAAFCSLQASAFEGNYSQASTVFSALSTLIEAHTAVGCTNTIEPMRCIGAAYEYTYSSNALEPLSAEVSFGLITPAYALGATSFSYITNAGRMLTGGIGGASVSLAELESIASDHAYGSARSYFPPMQATGGTYVRLNGYAFLSPAAPFAISAAGSGREPNSFAFTMSFSLDAYCGGYAQLEMPKPLLTAEATSSGLASAALKMPRALLTATGTVGSVGRIDMTMPMPKLSITATADGRASVAMKMPSPLLTATGFNGGLGKAALTMRGGFSLSAYSGALVSITLQDGFRIAATGTRGATGSVNITAPLFTLTATGTVAAGLNTVELTMPMMRMVNGGTADLTTGRYRLVAVGTATVAVDYEAYAVNLSHQIETIQPGTVPVHEATHYTNYPFDQIVRFHNKYYGVGPGGIFLLEGDTDAAAPIAWAFETHKTDFKDRQLKRAVSAYIGGRLEDQATATVVLGEEGAEGYDYTTPRSSRAQNYRVMFGKGLRSRYYAFGLADPAGNFIEVDSLDFEINTLGRAI